MWRLAYYVLRPILLLWVSAPSVTMAHPACRLYLWLVYRAWPMEAD